MAKNKQKKPKNRKVLKIVLVILLVIIGIVGGISATLVASVLKTVPQLEDIKFSPKLATSVYDRNGDLIQRLYTENRIWISIDEIPQQMQEAIIAIEDKNFPRHHGVDPVAILRSAFLNIKYGNLTAYGGSTITQQLAKNAFLTQEKRLTRKIKEAIWAIQIERGYTKAEILETYLNEIWFGHGTYGVEAASYLYFGKSVRNLSLEEMAMIAGVTNNPGLFSPRYNMEAAKKRRDLVLRRMYEENYITEEVYQETITKPIVLKIEKKDNRKTASYFIDQVIQYLLGKFDVDTVYGGGLKVYTTLDLNYQRIAEDTLIGNLPDGGVDKNGLNQPQGALITLDPTTGEILAVVGGRGQDKLNRAYQAYRQPGSAFKPFIYATALSQGYTPSSIFVDEPVEYRMPSGELWSVRNYHLDFKGPMTLRYALEMSINVVAVKLLDQVGISNVVNTIQNVGISSLVTSGAKNDKGLAPLALGALTKGVSLVQMAAAYGTFANQGIYCEPYFITRIEDPYGKVIEQNHVKPRTALDEKVAYVLTDMLEGVVTDGTAKQANIGRPQAGKTGTTDNYYDAWYVGYTPDLVTAIWVGEDLPSDMVYNGIRYGSWDCARIWGSYVGQITEGTEAIDFQRPEGIVDLKICTKSGLIAESYCPEESVHNELYIRGTEPKTVCTIHDPQTTTKNRNLISLDDDWGLDIVELEPEPVSEPEEKSTNLLDTLLGIFGGGSKSSTNKDPKLDERSPETPVQSSNITEPSTDEETSKSAPTTIEIEAPSKTEEDQEPQNGTTPVKIGVEETTPSKTSDDPDYLVTVEICVDSDKLATPACPASKIHRIKFFRGTEPTEECDVHGGIQ
ncbi:MAG: PBP1A family penicillin-binding protein [Firmicutes bacterium]|nr:PBP1A family penicillin-binding protein [Bacillota bacterium]